MITWTCTSDVPLKGSTVMVSGLLEQKLTKDINTCHTENFLGCWGWQHARLALSATSGPSACCYPWLVTRQPDSMKKHNERCGGVNPWDIFLWPWYSIKRKPHTHHCSIYIIFTSNRTSHLHSFSCKHTHASSAHSSCTNVTKHSSHIHLKKIWFKKFVLSYL